MAIYIANHIPYVRKHEFGCAGMELLLLEIALKKFKILCGVCYRPPNQCFSLTSRLTRHH